MDRLIFAGAFLLAMTAGCVATRTPAPASIPPATVEATPGRASIPQAPAVSAPSAAPAATATVVSPAPSPPPIAVDRPAKSKSAARPRASKPTPVPMQPAAAKVPGAPAAPPPPAKPTLNLADLEQRLRETPAIGVFTKLSLKNQVDDLLNEFRSYYQGPNQHPTPTLRQHYDLLLLKVLSLLQNADPPLAEAVASSREAIWGILADREKFSKI